ncbi:hypothetical protein U8V72_20855 [Priestia filamentosa]|uniref:hypothetical protein n=1 Tax=Priestia filamentosa TaxID=1402861 RepID=UPI003978131A
MENKELFIRSEEKAGREMDHLWKNYVEENSTNVGMNNVAEVIKSYNLVEVGKIPVDLSGDSNNLNWLAQLTFEKQGERFTIDTSELSANWQFTGCKRDTPINYANYDPEKDNKIYNEFEKVFNLDVLKGYLNAFLYNYLNPTFNLGIQK